MIGEATAGILVEARASTLPGYTSKDYERLKLADPDFSVGLTEVEALSIETVQQAVDLISGDLASFPLEKMILDGDNREVPHKTHPAWTPVHDEPTRFISAFKWWKRFYTQLLLWTHAYARININGLGEVESFTLLESGAVFHDLDENGEAGFWFINERGNMEFLNAQRVLHVEEISLHKSQVQGRTQTKPFRLIEAATKQFRQNLMVERYGTKFFEHGGRIGGWLQLPRQMTQKAKDSYEQQFRERYENIDAAFQVVVHRGEGELKFHPASQSDPEKTQMVEVRKELRRAVASRFKLPPHKLGDDTRISYNSLEQEEESYRNSSLSPRQRAVEDECKLKLLTPSQRRSGRHFFRHNIADTERRLVDSSAAAEVATKNYAGGIWTKNEARWFTGRQPVADGDTFLETPIGGIPPQQNQAQEEPEDERSLMREPLLEQLQKGFDSLARTIQRKARQLGNSGFGHWLEHELEKSVRKYAEANLRVVVRCYAKNAGISELELFEQIIRAFCAEIRKELRSRGRFEAQHSSVLLLERIENGHS